MRKLRLNLDEVKIESFEIEGIAASERGTVRGQQEDCPNGGGEGEDAGGCSCRCCACSCPYCCWCRCCGDGGEGCGGAVTA